MTPASDSGVVTLRTQQPVEEVLHKLEMILAAKGIKLFAVIDHSGEAQKAGLEMRPTKLAIFGNPKAGTPLMLASPTIAIDLPLKILIWESADGEVRVSYDSPGYLQARHNVPAELISNIAAVEVLAKEIAGSAKRGA